MRIAVLVLGLGLMVPLALQSFTIYSLASISNNEKASAASAVGIGMVLIWLVSSALVIAVPLLSAVGFVIAGILGVAMAYQSMFKDLEIWGLASFVLAILSVIGWITKRRGERREAKRHEELVSAVRLSAPNQAVVSTEAVGIVNESASRRPRNKDVAASHAPPRHA